MTRTHLPNRRQSETVEFTHEGHRLTASVSYDRQGRPLEVFLSAGKVGTGIEHAARDLAVVTSLALQHGVPLATLQHALTRLDNGKPAGPMGVLLDMVSRNGIAK